ncbi:MAG: hypothetical protein JWN07_91 [Hyphomicrobiales bacterium]|jgi:hypothetical protein|nr:hypothetical protein [Hyphomicrobiales bacterium]
MKRFLATFFLTAGLVTLAAGQASAAYCEARGTTGASGWGRSSSSGQAKRMALRQCAVRTPRRGYCRITYCS